MNRHYPIILLLLFVALRIAAQSNGTVTYTAADGLANANYLRFLQDRQGYLWVGSSSTGVSRFDGQHWQKWDVRTGLIQNAVSEIFEDLTGGIIFTHGDHESSRFFQDKFEKRPLAEGTLPFFDVFSKTLIRYNYSTGQILVFNSNTQRYELSGERLLPEEWFKEYTKITIQWKSSANTYLVAAWRRNFVSPDMILSSPGSTSKPKVIGHLPKEMYTAAAGMIGNGSVILADYGQRHFFNLQNGKIQPFIPPSLPNNTAKLTGVAWWTDQSTNTLLMVWKLGEKTIGTPRYLVADYDLSNFHLRQTVLFTTSFKVFHCFKDRAGTYWISTDATVMRVFPEHFFIPTEAPGMIPSAWAAAQDRNGRMWFSSYGSGLACFDDWNMHSVDPSIGPEAYFDNGSLVDGEGHMYFNAENLHTNTGTFSGIFKFDGSHKELLCPGTLGFFFAYDRQGRIMRGMHQFGLWILPKGKAGRDSTDWIKIGPSKGLKLENVLCAVEDTFGHYWMGRLSQGLACYDPGSDKVFNWIKSQDKPYYGVMSMDADKWGNIWLGTDRGLCFLKTPARVDSSLDILSVINRIGVEYTGETAVNTLKIYDNHTLLFGNAQGFYLLDLDEFYAQPQRITIQVYNPKNGNQLAGIEQNAIFVTREKQIWLLGGLGALRFDPRLAWRDTVMPSVHIDSLATDIDTFKEVNDLIQLGNGAQRVRIYYHQVVNALLLDNVRFRYRFSGDTTWSALIEGSQIEFPRLAPGTYTFEIIAEKHGMQSVPQRVVFRVSPVWWQNPWVWLIAMVSVVGVAVFFRNKERKIAVQKIQLEKTKTEMALMSKEKDKLQVQAIVNQLNPHFINNALQWLQVRVDEDEEAVRVVGKLSENIATVFKNSRQKKPYHALKHELKLAENYLFIQKCRFRERLQYDLPVGADLQDISEINVPLMIIQIHVENAVEHGIRSKTDGTGRVQIAVQHDADYMTITITDDGVGRAAAAQIGSRGTQNGTLMLKELASIYNRQNRLPIEQHYEDGIFTSPDGKSFGTRVVIRIPKVYQYDI